MKKNKNQISVKPPKSLVQETDPDTLRRIKNLLGLGVAAFAFLLYAQSVFFSYTYDDPTTTYSNNLVSKGLSGIPQLLKTDYWFGVSNFNHRVPEYRPAPLILSAVEWQFFPNNPHAGHVVNVLLFALTSWLLFLLLSKLFRKENLLFPFVCSLLFVVHPIHTEVVNSIKSDDEILCLLFAIASGLFLLKYGEKTELKHLILSMVFFFLCLVSKESGIVFLVLLPLMFYFYEDALSKKTWRVILACGICTIVYLAIRAQILKSVASPELNNPLNNTLYATKDFITREATAFYVLLRYIFLLVFPHPLASDYSYSQIKLRTFTDIGSVLGLLIYVGLGIYSILKIKSRSPVVFGVLFYLIALAPVSNIFILIGSTMAERFLYTPSIGFCIVLAWLLVKFVPKTLTNKYSDAKSFFTSNSRVFLIVAVLVLIYSVKTFSRSADWKNNVALYSQDIKTSDKCAPLHARYGEYIMLNLARNDKDSSVNEQYLDMAISEFNTALNIYDDIPGAWRDLSICYSVKKDELGEMNALDALSKYERDTVPSNLYHLGSLYYKYEKYDKAITIFENLKQKFMLPDTAFFNLGMLYNKLNQCDKALVVFDTALKYSPKNPDAHNNRGFALSGEGNYEEAIVEFQKAIALKPNFIQAYRNLGAAYGMTKRYSLALEYFNRALQIDPSNAELLNFIGVTYQNMGDKEKANLYFDKGKVSSEKKN